MKWKPLLHNSYKKTSVKMLSKYISYVVLLSKSNVSLCLMSIFSTNIWPYQGRKVGWRAIPTQYTKAINILTSTLAVFLFSSHPRRERDREEKVHWGARYGVTLKAVWKRCVLRCHLNIEKVSSFKTNPHESTPSTYDNQNAANVNIYLHGNTHICAYIRFFSSRFAKWAD